MIHPINLPEELLEVNNVNHWNKRRLNLDKLMIS